MELNILDELEKALNLQSDSGKSPGKMLANTFEDEKSKLEVAISGN